MGNKLMNVVTYPTHTNLLSTIKNVNGKPLSKPRRHTDGAQI